MATKLWLRPLVNGFKIPSTVLADTRTAYLVMNPDAFTASQSLLSIAVDGAVDSNGERQWSSDFRSERVTTAVTISGSVTVNVWISAAATVTARLRARLFKITAGGSNVESLIFQADAGSDLVVATTQYTLTGTPITTVVSPGERLILRVSLTPVGSFGTGNATLWYGEETVSVSGNSFVDVTEAVTFYPNGDELYFRRTAVNAIGNFYDFLPVLGSSAFTTAKVSSIQGSTQIQWTRTPTNPVNITEITAAVIASTTNATTYASASYTPVANRLYLLAVAHSDAAPESTVPTVTTTNGLTFVQVGSSIPFGTIASPGQRLTLFRAMKASGLSAGTHTVTLGDAGTGCAAVLAEATSVVTTGTNGADAVINIGTANADASANPAVTLAAFSHVNNGAFMCVGAATQTAPTIGSGWIALSHPDYATPAVGAYAQWTTANDTTPTATLVSSAWAGIGVELVAATPGDTTPVEWITGRIKAPGFYLYDAPLQVWISYLWAGENATLANCAALVKLFRRRPDGTETECYTMTGIELPNPTNGFTWHGGTVTSMGFVEDDRLVCRVYITNIGTMNGGFVCTLDYDGNATGIVDGNCYMHLVEGPLFKAEGDPAGTSRIEGGQTMSGVGN